MGSSKLRRCSPARAGELPEKKDRIWVIGNNDLVAIAWPVNNQNSFSASPDIIRIKTPNVTDSSVWNSHSTNRKEDLLVQGKMTSLFMGNQTLITDIPSRYDLIMSTLGGDISIISDYRYTNEVVKLHLRKKISLMAEIWFWKYSLKTIRLRRFIDVLRLQRDRQVETALFIV